MGARLLALAAVPVILLAEPDPEIVQIAPSADEILAEALGRANLDSALAQYTAVHTKRTLHLDQSGNTTAEHLDVYRVRPVGAEAFYELIERNGRAATERDLAEEARRRERFRESFTPEAEMTRGAGLAFALTRSLLERYDVTLTGRHPVHGWALAFQPRAGGQPAHRRIDQLLNRLEGTLWIHPTDFGLTRARFALREPMRIWGGLLGSLTRFEGQFEQTTPAPGRWLPRQLRLEMDGWAPFHSLRRRVELEWTEFEPAR